MKEAIDYTSLKQNIRAIPGIYDKVEKGTLAVREEVVSIQAINPFAAHNSASRGLMQTGQFAQLEPPINPEPKIIQDGVTSQLKDNTWSCKVKEDCTVKAIITSKDNYNIEDIETIILITELLDGTLDIIQVPLYYSNISEFGFKYVRNASLLSNLTVGTYLSAGTILADTPGVVDNTYAYGINAEMKLVTDPDVGQDGIKVSLELMEKMAYKTYTKIEASYSNDRIPLNLYGTPTNYIALPKVGDTINSDSIVFALREINPNLVPPNIYNTMVPDTNYDECFYITTPTNVLTLNGKQMYNNKVVSVKVYKSATKKDFNLEARDNIDGVAEDLKQIYRRVITTYERSKADKKITPRLSNFLTEAYAVASTDIKSELRYRNDAFTTRVEIVIETTVIPGIGSKLSCAHGGKGIVIKVVPKAELGADICMDPTSLPGRTNPGRIIEMKFNAASRNAKEIIVHDYHVNGLVSAFGLLVDFLSYFDTEQHLVYKYAYENRDSPSILTLMKETLEEITNKELYLYYKISSRKKAAKVLRSLNGTMWEVKKRPILINGKMTKKGIVIAPLYIILLAKTANHYLSSSSPYLNHYNIPVKPPAYMKTRRPNSNTPTKLAGETENRVLFTNTNNPEYARTLLSRNTNIESHKKIYKTFLTHPTPSNIDFIETRDENGKLPDGGPLAITKSVLRTMGIGTTTVIEKGEHEKY